MVPHLVTKQTVTNKNYIPSLQNHGFILSHFLISLVHSRTSAPERNENLKIYLKVEKIFTDWYMYMYMYSGNINYNLLLPYLYLDKDHKRFLSYTNINLNYQACCPQCWWRTERNSQRHEENGVRWTSVGGGDRSKSVWICLLTRTVKNNLYANDTQHVLTCIEHIFKTTFNYQPIWKFRAYT